ncbi:hypothetical protein D3C73_1675280 [compost metagenome]
MGDAIRARFQLAVSEPLRSEYGGDAIRRLLRLSPEQLRQRQLGWERRIRGVERLHHLPTFFLCH